MIKQEVKMKKEMKSIAENFDQFYSSFKVPSVEMALANFRSTPIIKKYIPLINPPPWLQTEKTYKFQEIEITFRDMSVFKIVEKIGNIEY